MKKKKKNFPIKNLSCFNFTNEKNHMEEKKIADDHFIEVYYSENFFESRYISQKEYDALIKIEDCALFKFVEKNFFQLIIRTGVIVFSFGKPSANASQFIRLRNREQFSYECVEKTKKIVHESDPDFVPRYKVFDYREKILVDKKSGLKPILPEIEKVIPLKVDLIKVEISKESVEELDYKKVEQVINHLVSLQNKLKKENEQFVFPEFLEKFGTNNQKILSEKKKINKSVVKKIFSNRAGNLFDNLLLFSENFTEKVQNQIQNVEKISESQSEKQPFTWKEYFQFNNILNYKKIEFYLTIFSIFIFILILKFALKILFDVKKISHTPGVELPALPKVEILDIPQISDISDASGSSEISQETAENLLKNPVSQISMDETIKNFEKIRRESSELARKIAEQEEKQFIQKLRSSQDLQDYLRDNPPPGMKTNSL
jgi:hypothetical protein